MTFVESSMSIVAVYSILSCRNTMYSHFELLSNALNPAKVEIKNIHPIMSQGLSRVLGYKGRKGASVLVTFFASGINEITTTFKTNMC